MNEFRSSVRSTRTDAILDPSLARPHWPATSVAVPRWVCKFPLWPFADGKDVNIDFRWAENDYGQLPVLARELVGLNVDLIVILRARKGSKPS